MMNENNLRKQENEGLLRLLDLQISRRRDELKQLLATREILSGGESFDGAPSMHNTSFASGTSEPWTSVARRLITEMPRPFRLHDLQMALANNGYDILHGAVSSWLSRMHKNEGLVIPEGSKKGLWLAGPFLVDGGENDLE